MQARGRYYLKALLLGVTAALASCLLALALGAPPAKATVPGENGKIAFVSDRDGNNEIYAMNADGTQQTNLTKNPAQEFTPTWSPDGTRLAFARNRSGNSEIYVVNANGSGLTNLSKGVANGYRSFDWSPDATALAFESYRSGTSEIYVANADGSGLRNISEGLGHSDSFDWSPDGTKGAFVSYQNGDSEIYVVNADGSGLTNLTNNSASEGGPLWSPDGTRIAFRRGYELYVMNADGSGQKELVGPYSSGYSWSPDGTKIAYRQREYSTEAEKEGCSYTGNFVMNADGTGTPWPIGYLVEDCGEGIAGGGPPVWSPDGSKLMFTSNGFHGIDSAAVVDADGTNLVRLGTLLRPVWSPDSTKIAFDRALTDEEFEMGQNFEVYAAKADGSEQTNLTNNRVDENTPSPEDTDPQWQSIPKCTVTGTSGNDVLRGTSGKDVICGMKGNDRIYGDQGSDMLFGGDGNDTFHGGAGNDSLNGGKGADTVSYSDSDTPVRASVLAGFVTGQGSDVLGKMENLTGSAHADVLTGSEANNTLRGLGGEDTIRGGPGVDSLVGGPDADQMYGKAGDDSVNSRDGVNGNDSLDGGTGTDTKKTDAREKVVVRFP